MGKKVFNRKRVILSHYLFNRFMFITKEPDQILADNYLFLSKNFPWPNLVNFKNDLI